MKAFWGTGFFLAVLLVLARPAAAGDDKKDVAKPKVDAAGATTNQPASRGAANPAGESAANSDPAGPAPLAAPPLAGMKDPGPAPTPDRGGSREEGPRWFPVPALD